MAQDDANLEKSEHNRAFGRLGITEDAIHRDKGLRTMGLTEEDFQQGQKLFNRRNIAMERSRPTRSSKVSVLTGFTLEQRRRQKAIELLGISEETIETNRAEELSRLGTRMSDVSVERRVLWSGWLEKQGARNRAWKSRYFVLDSDLNFFYFISDDIDVTSNLLNARGSIDLAQAKGLLAVITTDSHRSAESASAVNCTRINETSNIIAVISTDRTWHLRASPEQTDIWTTFLHKIRQIVPEALAWEWMGKRGGLRKAWKERFFVLCQGILVYYEDDSLREQCGVIELFRAVDVEIHAEDVEGPDSTNESKEKKDAPSSHHKSHSRARSSLTHTHTLHLFITGREFILSPIDSTQQNLTRWKNMLTAQIGGHTPQGVPYTRVVSELEDQFQDQFIACAQGFQEWLSVMPHVRTRLGLSPKQMDCPLLLPQTHTQLSEIDNQTILNKIDSLLDSMDIAVNTLDSLAFSIQKAMLESAKD